MTAGAPAILVRDLRKPTATSRPCAASTSRSRPARSSACSARTGPARRRPSRSSRATGGAAAASSRCSASTPASAPRALRERVGIVLQSCGMYRHIEVLEAVAPLGRPLPRAARPRRGAARSSASRSRREARTRTLSGGQLRRLDLALALVGDPELIFLDEPTTGFDPAARRAAWETIRRLQELGKTVLLTTHYLDEAQALCDRVAIVKDGRDPRRGPAGGARRGERALPRQLARRRRRAAHARGGRPDGAAAPADERGAGARRDAARPLGHAPEPRGRLPRADRAGAAGRSATRELAEAQERR